jgi:hypothetical protein
MTKVIGVRSRLGQTGCMTEEGPEVQPLLVDVRGLDPPLPMLRILELADLLAPGQRLVVTHERRPIFLYPLLEERGLSYETEELGPGEVRITIRNEEPAA